SGNGSTFSAITTGDVKAIEIPLPPLETQKRIADILDKADALRQKDQQLLQKYDELAQAIFMDMFGDPVRNEKGWEVKPLGDYIVDIVAGSSYGGEEKVLESDELGVLKISAVTSGIFNPNEFKAVKKSVIQKEVIKVRKGNLLFSRANTRELVGATCIVDKDYDDLFLPDKLWRIDLKAGCNTFYLKFLLSQKSVRYELNKTATGTSGSMLNISMPKLRDLKIIVPPINKQLDFEKRIIKLCSNQSLVGKETAKSESLFQSLLQQAFNGELVNEKAVTEVI
ncbi:MAG: restriction endonuclease subunit S, partial [Bacteroidota bacterium]|nr:restriction endonuclease subunit S [Bacteroidota bacterium]